VVNKLVGEIEHPGFAVYSKPFEIVVPVCISCKHENTSLEEFYHQVATNWKWSVVLRAYDCTTNFCQFI